MTADGGNVASGAGGPASPSDSPKPASDAGARPPAPLSSPSHTRVSVWHPAGFEPTTDGLLERDEAIGADSGGGISTAPRSRKSQTVREGIIEGLNQAIAWMGHSQAQFATKNRPIARTKRPLRPARFSKFPLIAGGTTPVELYVIPAMQKEVAACMGEILAPPNPVADKPATGRCQQARKCLRILVGPVGFEPTTDGL